MKKQIDLLIKLQQIETETSSLKSNMNNLPERLNALDKKLESFEKKIKDEESLSNELKKEYRAYESDIQLKDNSIEKAGGKLRAVKTNKEYQSLLKEEEQLRRNKSLTEDKMIECLDKLEEVTKIVAKRRNEYLNFSEHVNKKKEAIKKEVELKKGELSQLESDWKDFSQKIAPELLKQFISVKNQIRGIAIVPVKDAVCQGCNMNIPAQLYNELHRFDKLNFCPHCQRMIYWKDC